jgi:hypothetical protein
MLVLWIWSNNSNSSSNTTTVTSKASKEEEEEAALVTASAVGPFRRKRKYTHGPNTRTVASRKWDAVIVGRYRKTLHDCRV